MIINCPITLFSTSSYAYSVLPLLNRLVGTMAVQCIWYTETRKYNKLAKDQTHKQTKPTG